MNRVPHPCGQDHNKLISPDEFGHLLYAIFGYTYKKPRKDAPSVSLTKLLNALYAKWKEVRAPRGPRDATCSRPACLCTAPA